MSDFRDRYADLGAFINGGTPRRTVPMPPPPIPQPARPTTAMTVDGIALEPASRLAALASIRDRHRASARFASDRAHDLREKITEREQRVRFLAQTAQPGFEAEYDAQIALIEGEIGQLRAAMQTASDEAAEASEAAGAAQQVLRAAIKFAIDAGATLPITLASEVQK